jgi:muconate cycloisomerase
VKIATIEAIPYALPTVRPHRLAMATITEQTLVLVRVRDDDGGEGVGEAGIIPHYSAETQHGICQLVEETIAPSIIGHDPRSLETLVGAMDKQIKGNNYAKGAVEMACVDLAARAAGVPAHQLFGGLVRDCIPVFMSRHSGRTARLTGGRISIHLSDNLLVQIFSTRSRAHRHRA